MSSPLDLGLAADLAAHDAFSAERCEYGHTAKIYAILAAERLRSPQPVRRAPRERLEAWHVAPIPTSGTASAAGADSAFDAGARLMAARRRPIGQDAKLRECPEA